ncbi:MAG: MoxR family ATPase [Bdellovibrionota bacterium]
MTNLLEIHSAAKNLKNQLKQAIFGQDDVLDKIIVTILCGGHALVTGAPGLAKTTIVKALACSLNCEYKRIQFTPDLTPFDILGGDTIEFDAKNPDIKRIVFAPGPLFSQFILADEINRASPRTQSALLEAMQERQISVGGVSKKLPDSFFVFATQNPIENEGTFPLPEAQLDRFLLNIEIDYPDLESEVKIAMLPQNTTPFSTIENFSILLEARKQIESMFIDEKLIYAIVRIVRNTRPEESKLSIAKNYFEYGASPRASQSLLMASKAFAVLQGAQEVSFTHIKAMAACVLKHRCIVNYKCMSENKNVLDIIKQIVEETIL